MPRRYQRLSSFIHLPAGEVVSLLQEQQSSLEAQLEALETEREEADEAIAALKQTLKAKFGGSINLER
jgi:chaperonin cofactor prefoldin